MMEDEFRKLSRWRLAWLYVQGLSIIFIMLGLMHLVVEYAP